MDGLNTGVCDKTCEAVSRVGSIRAESPVSQTTIRIVCTVYRCQAKTPFTPQYAHGEAPLQASRVPEQLTSAMAQLAIPTM